MPKILLVPLGLLLITGCDEWDVNYDNWSSFDTASYQGDTMDFARGEALSDASTYWGDTTGFALGTDRFGALGMVGMVCSFGTNDGFLRIDLDPDEGDEVVVDAVAMPGQGFATLSVDGGQVTVTEFPEEWDGAIAVDVVVNNPPEDAGLTDDQIVLAQHGVDCILERRDRSTGDLVLETTLDGDCVSELVTDPATGTVYISTETGTWAVDTLGNSVSMGPPATLLDFDPATSGLLKGNKGESEVSLWGVEESWSTPVDGALVSLDFISGGRVVAGVSTAEAGALIVLDASSGERIETVDTLSFRRVQVSPEGGMLAVRGPLALHLVRVD